MIFLVEELKRTKRTQKQYNKLHHSCDENKTLMTKKNNQTNKMKKNCKTPAAIHLK